MHPELVDLLDRAGAAAALGVGEDYLSTRLRDRLPPVLTGRHPIWHRAHLAAHRAGQPLPTVTVPTWLVDRDGVAQALGIAPESVSRYLGRHRDTFPAQVLPGWYDARDVTAWKASRPGRTGRPPKIKEHS